MKKSIVQMLKNILLYDFVIFYYIQFRLYKRIAFGTDKRIIKRYSNKHRIKKLQIGTGDNFLEDWINSDIDLNSDKKIYLDARKPFPFEDSTFNYVFSEHMIEHLTYQEGMNMLSECYRVLTAGGKIRIATPNLQFLFDLYASNKSKLHNEYIKWTAKKINISCRVAFADTFVINNFFRKWNHKFIYDEKALRYVLEKIGFTDIKKYDLNKSDDEQLQGLENERRMPPGFLKLESIALEGMKPITA
jgi:predicted SAM-dependent methyltransferase